VRDGQNASDNSLSQDDSSSLMQAKGWDPTMQLEFCSPTKANKPIGEQSGGPAGVTATAVTEPSEGKANV